jgi:hypothetical protein
MNWSCSRPLGGSKNSQIVRSSRNVTFAGEQPVCEKAYKDKSIRPVGKTQGLILIGGSRGVENHS